MVLHLCFFFFKQKTAYEMRISDWSSDVCSSDLFAEVSFHLPEFQCGEETRAAKAVNQAPPDGHGLDGITLLEREQPPKSEPKGHTSLRLKRDDARIDGKEARFVRFHPERILDQRTCLGSACNADERIPPFIVLKASQCRPHFGRREMQVCFIFFR